ncbi:hypothetical protein Bhyg_07157 [Pseudolycoriella hygida]|uniref:C2H2-type domain-containing protein n=1 Tax=Pseudolycoriella hygida TaxID=35572 RepID=A0A9Q0S3P5_9DIPT|nr:hypothetical protein Bhyg_07157 [Pseudolycoriella hygida]
MFYRLKNALTRHIRHACSKTRSYECPICLKRFGYAFYINKHIETVHHMPNYYSKDFSSTV